MSTCPSCGRYAAPCRETGYNGDDFCSEECEDAAMTDAERLEEAENLIDAFRKQYILSGIKPLANSMNPAEHLLWKADGFLFEKRSKKR